MNLINNSVNYEDQHFNLRAKLTTNVDNTNYKIINSCSHSDPTPMGFYFISLWMNLIKQNRKFWTEMPHRLSLSSAAVTKHSNKSNLRAKRFIQLTVSSYTPPLAGKLQLEGAVAHSEAESDGNIHTFSLPISHSPNPLPREIAAQNST